MNKVKKTLVNREIVDSLIESTKRLATDKITTTNIVAICIQIMTAVESYPELSGEDKKCTSCIR